MEYRKQTGCFLNHTEKGAFAMKRTHDRLNSCYAVVTATDESGVYMRCIDNGEELVCHDWAGELKQGTSVFVTILSIGREQNRYRRAAIDCVDYDSAEAAAVYTNTAA